MTCDSRDIALKSLFLGPQAENAPWVHELVEHIFRRWYDWRRGLFSGDGRAISARDQENPEFLERKRGFEAALAEALTRFEGEVPKFSPRYIGHMFSELSLPALLGHVIALLHNPNNISGESSLVGVSIEDEAVAALLEMVGFVPAEGAGHFTSGGTVANLEALVRARSRAALWLARAAAARRSQSAPAGAAALFDDAHSGWAAFDARHGAVTDETRYSFTEENPWSVGARLEQVYGVPFRGPVVLVPENKHYSWQKGVSLLGLGEEAFWPIELDERGKLSRASLELQLERARREGRPVLCVVSVAGTTELGVFDPIDEVEAVLERWRREKGLHVWHHVDAAYGGFFRTVGREDRSVLDRDVIRALEAMARADSITLDPHKLGYVPYASGAFVARLRRDYQVKGFQAPYVQFGSRDRGPFTIEGSRSAAGALATWMIARTVGLREEGYGRIIARTVRVKRELEEQLRAAGLEVRIAPYGEANILCFAAAREGESLSASNARTERLYERFSPRGGGPFFVSKTTLSRASYGRYLERFAASWGARLDADRLVLVRMCLMNPFFNSRETAVNFPLAFVRALAAELSGTGSA